MKIVRCQPGHETILANYFAVNEEHLRRWSPAVPDSYHSIESWSRRLAEREEEFERRESAHFIGTDRQESHVLGLCSLSNIVFGVLQACYMGYSIAERYQGQGEMKRIVVHAIEFAFNELNLHRVMANHMPSNERSAGLLSSLGFEKEGLAKDYLLIDGKWEDHVLNSLLNPNFQIK